MSRKLTAELAHALGLPKYTTREVLTLDIHQPPRIELDVMAIRISVWKGQP